MTDENVPSTPAPEDPKGSTPPPAEAAAADTESATPEPPAPEPDASEEAGDLSSFNLDFTPTWARKEPGTVSEVGGSRGDKNRGGPRRGQRGGARDDRRGGPRGDQRGGSRGDQRGGSRGDQRGGSRGDERGGDRRGPPRHPAQHSGGQDGRAHSGHGRPHSGAPGARAPRLPRLPVRIDFIPNNQRLKKVIQVMKEARRAFPIDELAGKFISNPGFFAVKITVHQPKEGVPEPVSLFQMVHTRWVFMDQAACEQHALEYGLDTLFVKEEIPVDPPSGQFVGVSRCRLGGELIGPPNWHGHLEAVEKLRREKYARMEPDEFRKTIELSRDEEQLEAWKASMSVACRYRKKKPGEDREPEKTEAQAEPVEAEATGGEPVATKERPPVAEDVPAEHEAEGVDDTPAIEDAPAVEEKPAGEQASVEPEATADEEAPADEESAPVEETASLEEEPEPMLSRSEAEASLKGPWLKDAVKEGSRFIMPGTALTYLPACPLKHLISHVRDREAQGHMTLLRALKPAFKHMHLHVFQDEGRAYVTAIVPTALDLEHTVPEMSKVVDFVKAQPGCTGKEVLEALCPGCNPGEQPAKQYVAALHMLVDRGQLIEFQDDRLKLPKIKP